MIKISIEIYKEQQKKSTIKALLYIEKITDIVNIRILCFSTFLWVNSVLMIFSINTKKHNKQNYCLLTSRQEKDYFYTGKYLEQNKFARKC